MPFTYALHLHFEVIILVTLILHQSTVALSLKSTLEKIHSHTRWQVKFIDKQEFSLFLTNVFLILNITNVFIYFQTCQHLSFGHRPSRMVRVWSMQHLFSVRKCSPTSWKANAPYVTGKPGPQAIRVSVLWRTSQWQSRIFQTRQQVNFSDLFYFLVRNRFNNHFKRQSRDSDLVFLSWQYFEASSI